MTAVRGPSMTHAKRRARVNAEDTISSLVERELSLQTELKALAHSARQAKGVSGNNALRAVLTKSKGVRQQLTITTKKKNALQGHLDTLKNSDLNEQVLSSVKETSVVLKNMGLDKSLSDMDDMVADLQEAHTDLNALQEGLSESFTSTPNDADIERELELLLSDNYGALEELGTVPTMSTTNKTAPLSMNSLNRQETSNDMHTVDLKTTQTTEVADAEDTSALTEATVEKKSNALRLDAIPEQEPV